MFNKSLNLTLYKQIYLIRKAEEAIIKYYPQDEMKTPMHMSFGQEAIPVGVCQALTKNDKVLSSYRTHALYLAKTGETDLFFSEMFGKRNGLAQGKAGSMHLTFPEFGYVCSSAIVASQIPVSLGVAFANQQLKTGNMTAVFFGDGAIEEGAFWESINIACLKKLPLLFVLEDNRLAVHTAKHERHGFKDIKDVISQYDCFVPKEVPHEVEEIYSLTTQCLDKIRKQGRPAFLHAECYRHLEHVGINYDFKDRYRSETEYKEWLTRDPIAAQRQKLIKGNVTEPEITALEKTLDAQIEKSVEIAKNGQQPVSEDLYQGIFS